MHIWCHIKEYFLFALSDPEEDFDKTKSILTRMAHQPELRLSDSQQQYYRVRQNGDIQC